MTWDEFDFCLVRSEPVGAQATLRRPGWDGERLRWVHGWGQPARDGRGAATAQAVWGAVAGVGAAVLGVLAEGSSCGDAGLGSRGRRVRRGSPKLLLLVLAPLAEADLDRTRLWVAAVNPDAADKPIDRVFKTASTRANGRRDPEAIFEFE